LAPRGAKAIEQQQSFSGLAAEPQVADFVALMKPRVMSLVVFTALVGLLVAPGEIHPVIGFAAILAIAVGAGASGALNMWYEADLDARMVRTRDRPIPSGRMERGVALGFGVSLSIASVSAMGLMVNWVAAGLLAFTIFFYVVVYTIWLKRRTPQNIVIGGAAGALPPVVAWAAVQGTVGLEPLVLFAIIFFWTPPHFWSLSLFCRQDYERAGLPMLPVVAGEAATRRQILYYSLFLAPLSMVPWVMGLAGPAYGIVSLVLGVAFVFLAWKVQSNGDAAAPRLFRFSLLYLFSLFAVLGSERLIGGLL
jgi:protoheme IX farnesyltransferase